MGSPDHARDELSRLLDSMPGAVVQLDAHGAIASANAAARRMFGLRRDANELPYILDAELCEEDGAPWQGFVRTMAGSRGIGIRRADGTTVWAIVETQPRLGPKGEDEGVTVVLLDVTDKKAAAEDLRRTERKWRTLAHDVPDFIGTVDRNGDFLTVNHVLPGMTEEQVLGAPLWAFIPKEKVEWYKGKFAEALASTAPTRFETYGCGVDGSTAWYETTLVPLEESAFPERMLIVARDITDRKRAEEAVHAIEHKWRALVESLPENVIIVDRERTILSTNRDGTYPHATVIGMKVDPFIETTELAQWLQHFTIVLETGVARRLDTRGFRGPGHLAWYESILVPLKEAGVVERVMIVARDISERREMLSRLAEKERLASVGMVASSVAHEIMNPLTYVLASLELALNERDTEEPERRKAVKDAREGAMRMQQIVWDLRSLGRTRGEELFYVDARRVLETALRISSHEVSRAARIVLELDEIPGVVASESQLCQVFINLLVNAAQAVAECPATERKIVVRTRHDEALGLVDVAFADTGVGIPSDQIAHIFEPFYTTKGSGMGLGLSISRDIVKRMGGRILVESEPGRGTTFTVSLSTTRADQPRVV
jgi:PAS domain S-box-containing protein